MYLLLLWLVLMVIKEMKRIILMLIWNMILVMKSMDISKALELLCAEGAPRELLELAEEGLVISCGARFTRCSRGIKWFDGTEAELALDKGLLWGDTHREPLCEVELELKAGNEATLEGEAVAFARRYGLVPQPKGKFQRARDLRLRGE